MKKREKLIAARRGKGWSQEALAEKVGVARNTLSAWERGIADPYPLHVQRLCEVFALSAEELDLTIKIRPSGEILEQAKESIEAVGELSSSGGVAEALKIAAPHLASLQSLLLSSKHSYQAMGLISNVMHSTSYARGVSALHDLYFEGARPDAIDALLPLYAEQTAMLALQSSPTQRAAARIASQAQRLLCEVGTDREDYGTAQQAGQRALYYGELAQDPNLPVAALISLGTIAFHRRFSATAVDIFERAIALFSDEVTPLLKGRTYAGIAEVYAMQGELQKAMTAMGLAYDVFPMEPEKDPAYPYIRASRYSLYVFGDAQSRLFLDQPKEANKALITMAKETNDPEVEPITRLDLLYYQAETQIRQREIVPSTDILTEAALLAKSLDSRLYFSKLVASYETLRMQWPREAQITALKDVFRPW
jgi:transcriptional regulator with XRE-family HTH domain